MSLEHQSPSVHARPTLIAVLHPTDVPFVRWYQANEIAADNKYKGKQLLVTGTVASIDKGPFGGLVLRLATYNEFMSTMCDMEKSEMSQLASLQKGQQVRVLCKGRGMVLGSPSLDDCVLR
jgi:hypothetical protein